MMDSARTLIAWGQTKSLEGATAPDPLSESLALSSAQQAVQLGATLARTQDDLDRSLLDILA